MKKYLILIILCLFFSGCTSSVNNRVYQTSTIDALLAGLYDGQVPCRNLLKKGDFGIGTFDSLDGEMILLDGKIFKVRADGKVYFPGENENTPFATVCKFSPDFGFDLNKKTDFPKFCEILDSAIENKNLFYAIKVKGEFDYITTRSVPSQSKPYPPLKEVTRNQPEFVAKNIKGTIVGFRCPAFVKGINVPGYHLHFLSEDKKFGGHILEFNLGSARVYLDLLNNYSLVLPVNNKDFKDLDLSIDRSRELKEVEK